MQKTSYFCNVRVERAWVETPGGWIQLFVSGPRVYHIGHIKKIFVQFRMSPSNRIQRPPKKSTVKNNYLGRPYPICMNAQIMVQLVNGVISRLKYYFGTLENFEMRFLDNLKCQNFGLLVVATTIILQDQNSIQKRETPRSSRKLGLLNKFSADWLKWINNATHSLLVWACFQCALFEHLWRH